jgi:hypothetical protein
MRLVFYRYGFTDPGARRRTGDWWTRQRLRAGEPGVVPSSQPPDGAGPAPADSDHGADRRLGPMSLAGSAPAKGHER